jgi:hypothetical protein
VAHTNLSLLVLPGWAIPTAPRATAVAGQRITIRTSWWESRVRVRGLPGATPSTAELSRADVWRHADDVFTLLWHALAWGSGRYLRQNGKRLAALAADVEGARSLLESAVVLSRTSPGDAYALLHPGRWNAIKHLGPSFFTKFLYFAGRGAPDHPSLILDSRVATSLRDECGWKSMDRSGPWSPETYAGYCDLLRGWSREHDRAADEIELKLFQGFNN